MKYREFPPDENNSPNNVFTVMDFLKILMEMEYNIFGYNQFIIKDTAVINNYLASFATTPKEYSTQISISNGCTYFNWGYYSLFTGEFVTLFTESVCYFDPGDLVFTSDLPVNTSGGGGGGGYTPPYIPLQTLEEQKTNFLINELNLNLTQQFCLTTTTNAVDVLYDYLFNNNTPQARDIAIWAISYFSLHPNLDLQIFQNQFLGKPEGSDCEFDPFWEDQTLTFPQQNLPSWNDFSANFPKDSDPLYDTPLKLFNSIGGVVASLYTGPETNTCAVRLSKALNYSGVVIPNLPGKTFRGADNKYYFKAAYQINEWMRKTFGTNPATSTTPYNQNHYSYSQADAGENGTNLPQLLLGKKGIYSIYSSNFNWASGHADLLYPNSTCGNNCHFSDAHIFRLDIWILN